MDERSGRHPIAKPASKMWILAGLAAIALGVLAGTIVQPRQWAWTPPVAGFVLDVLAFRRGLSRVQDFDAIWREGVRRRPRNLTGHPTTESKSTHLATLIRGDFVKPAREGGVHVPSGPEAAR